VRDLATTHGCKRSGLRRCRGPKACLRAEAHDDSTGEVFQKSDDVEDNPANVDEIVANVAHNFVNIAENLSDIAEKFSNVAA
jgi:hypothetical protein